MHTWQALGADWAIKTLTDGDQRLLRVLREGPQPGETIPSLPSYSLRKRLAGQALLVAERLLFWSQRAEPQAADALLSVAVSVAPNHAPARIALAWRLFAGGDPWEACRQAAIAYELAPQFAAAAYGFFLLETQNSAKAEAVLLPALAATPNDPPLNWYVGRLRLSKGLWLEAAQALRAACRADPSLADAAFDLAWLLHDLGEFDEAVAWSNHALAAGPTGDRLLQAAWFALRRRDYANAEALYRRAAECIPLPDPRNQRAYQHWAEALQALGRGDEALCLLKKAVAHYTLAAPLWYRLGCIAQELGDWRTADYALGQAHTLEPSLAETYFRRARCLWRRDQAEGMAWLLEQTLFLAPEMMGARALLAETLRGLEHDDTLLPSAPQASGQAATADLVDMTKAQLREKAAQDFALWYQTGRPLRLPIGPEFDSSVEPDISVVIVLFNQAGFTLQALQALADQAGPRFETIVVDNGSTDDTEALLARLEGAVIVRNAKNLGFLHAANQGAARARGRHILFLNSDAQVQPMALAAALGRLDGDPTLGAVGGAILLANGRLQEAGNSLYRDGAAIGYGRGDWPDAPEYQSTRDVDYCSGAFLLVRRPLWEMLGGFDPAYAPAYYEDADFCLRVWRAGFRVVYEPGARVIHVEGGSALHDAEPTRLMVANQAVLVARHPELQARPRATDAIGESIGTRSNACD